MGVGGGGIKTYLALLVEPRIFLTNHNTMYLTYVDKQNSLTYKYKPSDVLKVKYYAPDTGQDRQPDSGQATCQTKLTVGPKNILSPELRE